MPFTLYVARDRRHPARNDVGSVLCLQSMRDVPDGHVTVIACERMRTRPSFLRGTPTMVDDDTGEVFAGHAAVRRMHLLALYHAEQHGVERGRADVRGASGHAGGHGANGNSANGAHGANGNGANGNGADDATDDATAHLWSSQIVEDEDVEPIGERKLTSEDLGRIVSARGGPRTPPPSSAPPPPPPSRSD